MADINTPTAGAPAAAPVATPPSPFLPNVTERLTVPASALGLDTDASSLRITKGPDALTAALTAGPSGPTGPTGPATPPAPATGASGPAASAPASLPTAPAAPTGPTAPAAPAPKVKIGDKEYTQAELEKILADRAAQNEPAPAPAAPAVAAPAPAAPSKEQIAEAEKVWCDTLVKNEALNFLASEAEMETLLGGGKEAVAFFAGKLTEVAAKAVLLARKSIYAELNPQMENFSKLIQPLFANHAQVERVAMEQAFITAHPEYKGQHIETARQVAESLIERFPQHVQRMTQNQFIAAVNDQTDRILQAEYIKWNPTATNTWRDAARAGAAPAPAAPTPPAPAPAPAPAAAPDPWRQAPAANSPASIPATPAADWNKSVAQSLRD